MEYLPSGPRGEWRGNSSQTRKARPSASARLSCTQGRSHREPTASMVTRGKASEPASSMIHNEAESRISGTAGRSGMKYSNSWPRPPVRSIAYRSLRQRRPNAEAEPEAIDVLIELPVDCVGIHPELLRRVLVRAMFGL